MKLVAEISLYPLAENYIGPIKDFIHRLNQYDTIDVITTGTSTTVSGEYQHVWEILGKEMQATHQEVGQAVLVCKFLNGDCMD
ncbi:YkoF family thiamine/hydroxymethylpyrimidine-binding protein [Aestuariibacter salexigens]|uniref:YkoF family thiamine/hydroxymethylpyrimidine-binding protein n=1 Tax=Aestuariibacter salexigens TaxID=226010 RepID=UPI0003F4F172|nr:YkoF family thiamine/hydroxymethylpyrimidine-binding protein [Aestuariibacter salexigens]